MARAAHDAVAIVDQARPAPPTPWPRREAVFQGKNCVRDRTSLLNRFLNILDPTQTKVGVMYIYIYIIIYLSINLFIKKS